MGFEQITGQDRAIAMLRTAVETGKIAHAYLFAGPSGSGKLEVANVFAQAILCEHRKGDACGECLACRKVRHGNHPDLHHLAPDGASVKIEQVRALQRELSYRSAGSGYKIYVISQAESMTPQAANSLLKFLEEPPSPVIAILLATSSQAVLPTLLSRSQLIPFVPGDRMQLERLLIAEGKPPLLARAAVHLMPGLAASRKLADENWFAESRNVVIQLGREHPSRFAANLLIAQQKVFKTELADHVETIMQLLALWYRDMVYVMTGRQQQLVFPDQEAALAKLAGLRSIGAWVKAMEAALAAANRIKAHVSPQLAVEQFLVNMREG